MLNYVNGWLQRGSRESGVPEAVETEVSALLGGMPGKLRDLLPVLGPSLNLILEPTPASTAVVEQNQQEVVCRALYLFLLQQIAGREGHTVFAIDNGLFVDEMSWAVLEDLVASQSAEALRARWYVQYARNKVTLHETVALAVIVSDAS